MSAATGSAPSATARTADEQGRGSGVKGMVWHTLLLLGLLAGLAAPAPAGAEETTLRLVTMIDRDDQGEGIDFPLGVHYDYWTSETYLISSTERVTIYDQKFFPVASFGAGRGLGHVTGLTVDRRGNIYVCQQVPDGDEGKRSRLTIYNQAFFPIREVFVAKIPELAGFAAHKVAVAESGEIYLAGRFATEELAGVAVLNPEGGYLRTLLPPEKSAYRPAKKAPPAAAAGDPAPPPPELAGESDPGTELAAALPAGLKPKASARSGDDEEGKESRGLPYISDVKIDHQGRIYLLSREVSQIYVFNTREEYLLKFGEKGGAEGKLSTPLGLAVDVERRIIYVSDYMRHTILCYDYDSGRFIFEFGGQGIGPLWFNYPNSITVDQRGRVLVSDLFNRRVQVIDPNLEERRPISKAVPAAPPPPAVEVAAAPAPPLLEPPPPAPAALAAPAWVGMPSGVGAAALPALPGPAIGPGLAAVRSPLPRLTPPPERARPLPIRELVPRRLKKSAPPARAVIAPATPASPSSPRLMPRPGPVRFPREARATGAPRRLAEPAAALLAQLRSLPSAVGVYGPVAALLGVGGQLLITNR